MDGSVNRRRNRFVLAFAVLLAVAVLGCTSRPADRHPAASTTDAAASVTGAGTPSLASRPDYDRLFVRTGSEAEARLAVVDALSGTVVRDLPFGVPAPDWSTLYTAAPVEGSASARTVVRAISVATGEALRETTVDGTFALPQSSAAGEPGGLSPGGGWLVLASAPRSDAGNPQTAFVVLGTDFTLPPKRVALGGEFWFDAINNGGKSLYLIERMGAQYRVRRFDLVSGRLDPGAVVEKGAVTELMSGDRVAALPSRVGAWVFSLYVRGESGPFVHALNLDGSVAVCIDLPASIAAPSDGGSPPSWSLALNADSQTLYVVNDATGSIVAVDVQQFRVIRSGSMALGTARARGPVAVLGRWLLPGADAKEPSHGGVALAPDGRTLFVGGEHGLAALDVTSLAVRSRYPADHAIAGVALSPDGGRLYAMDGESGVVLAMDTATGRVLAQIPAVPGATGLLHVESGP